MTAIVGILNKHGVALAADSAVTVNTPKGRKILNSANKIIRLSKRHPVGVMMYSSASFLGTPWDVIIKMYRNEKIDKSFDKVESYQQDFINFLKKNDFFSTKDVQDGIFALFVTNVYRNIHKLAIERIGSSINDENKQYILQVMEDIMENYKQKLNKVERCPEFEDYHKEEFVHDYHKMIDTLISPNVEDKLKLEEHMAKVEDFLFATVVSSLFIGVYTGLVFVGYGDNEIFPSLIPINVSFVVSGRLKYAVDKEHIAIIGNGENQTSASIRPFAQTDVIDTILRGVDENIENIFTNVLREALENFRNILSETISTLPNMDKDIGELIKLIDVSTLAQGAKEKIQGYIQNHNVKQLMSTIEYLEKDDLASMAESLVSLTSLKRRIMSSEESVGGPVDVAIISKGDGFVWIKRKLYFNKEINQQYFETYNQ